MGKYAKAISRLTSLLFRRKRCPDNASIESDDLYTNDTPPEFDSTPGEAAEATEGIDTSQQHRWLRRTRPGKWLRRQDTAKFPWRFVQVVDEEENWQATWVLEVKDVASIDWGTVQVPNERGTGIKYIRHPTRQLPFLPYRDAWWQSEPPVVPGQDGVASPARRGFDYQRP